MSDAPPRRPVYPGGIDAILAGADRRRDPLKFAPGQALPPADVALKPLAAATVGDPAADPALMAEPRWGHMRKAIALRAEFVGQSELCWLNALLIAHLRKREPPPGAAPLFLRIWSEEGAHLLDRLGPRWLVSSVTTFGDHGATPAQRSVGLALSILFGAMKLYESERLFSGLPPEAPFPPGNRAVAGLALDMAAYPVEGGDLDLNMIARLWQEAADDAVIRPLAHRLLGDLIHDPRSVFARYQAMRAPQGMPQRPSPEGARWGVVALGGGPADALERFAAHHEAMGAAEVHLYLDPPDAAAAARLAANPRVAVTQCDAAFWSAQGKARPEDPGRRMTLAATRSLRAVEGRLDWLVHLAPDEWLWPDVPLGPALARLPEQVVALCLPVAEALRPAGGAPTAFRLPPGSDDTAIEALQALAPAADRGALARLLSPGNRVIARVGLPGTRLSPHALRRDGRPLPAALLREGVCALRLTPPDPAALRARAVRPGDPCPGDDPAALAALADRLAADSPPLRDALRGLGLLREIAPGHDRPPGTDAGPPRAGGPGTPGSGPRGQTRP